MMQKSGANLKGEPWDTLTTILLLLLLQLLEDCSGEMRVVVTASVFWVSCIRPVVCVSAMCLVLWTVLTFYKFSAKLLQSWDVFHFECNTNASSSPANTALCCCDTEPCYNLYNSVFSPTNSVLSLRKLSSYILNLPKHLFRDYPMFKSP